MTRSPDPALAALFFLLGDRIVYFDAGPRFQGTQNLVAASDDFVTLLQSLGNFDIRGPADSGLDRDEFRFLVADDEHALDLFLLLRWVGRGAGGSYRTLVRVLVFQIRPGTDRKRLNGDAEHAVAGGGRDLRRRGQAGAQFGGRILHRHHDFEVLRLLAGRGRLRRGDAGGAHDGVVADLTDDAVEDFARDGVDGHVGGLAEMHVDDVGLVHLDFGGDHRHVGDRHQGAARRI